MNRHLERRRLLAQWEAEAQRADAADDARAEEIEAARAAARSRRGRSPSRAVELAAHHEAGHCVTALALGRTVLGVMIDGAGRGRCWFPSGHGAGPVAYAGAAAEASAGELAAHPSLTDHATAGDGHPDLDRFGADEILAANAGKVEELAEALIEHGFLDARSIQSVVGRPRLPTLTL